jgi:hypothetical protein
MRVVSARLMAGALVAAMALALSACGGGGGGGGSTPTPGGSTSPTPTGPTWSPGVFPARSTYENFCATVRTGRDLEGNTFPDRAGSLLQELFWLRSWTRETYLWNTEVADQNPALFTDRLAYFNVLKTNASTPSGRAKDQFHFALLTSDYLAQVLSAPTAGYGAELRVYASTPPRDVRVLYTQAGTPAAELLLGTPKLARGSKIIRADGVDVINGGSTQAQIDTLNNALFPKTAGENHTFDVLSASGVTRTITLTSASIVETPVNRTAVLPTATGNVGYMLLNTFSPYSTEKGISDAINALKTQGVSDLVVDLRYNGGGLLAIAAQLGWQIAGPTRTNGKIFQRLQFNATAGSTNPVTGGTNTPTPFISTGVGFSLTNNAPLQSLALPRVYVLSTASTCSASEAVINGLRGANVEVVLIGTTTCGKPYGFYAADNCGETYFSIQFQGVNDQSFGSYADGFAAANSPSAFPVKIPGCAVADDLSRELGDASEGMLAAALNYRATATCPTPAAAGLSVAAVRGDGPEIAASGRSLGQELLRGNMDMSMPGAGSVR